MDAVRLYTLWDGRNIGCTFGIGAYMRIRQRRRFGILNIWKDKGTLMIRHCGFKAIGHLGALQLH